MRSEKLIGEKIRHRSVDPLVNNCHQPPTTVYRRWQKKNRYSLFPHVVITWCHCIYASRRFHFLDNESRPHCTSRLFILIFLLPFNRRLNSIRDVRARTTGPAPAKTTKTKTSTTSFRRTQSQIRQRAQKRETCGCCCCPSHPYRRRSSRRSTRW